MIPFYRPSLTHAELLSALRLGGGRSEFEATVAARMGALYGVAFAYGRSGLFAIFKSLGIEQSQIVLTAYTCVVVAQAIVASGNQPVFIDIDPDNYNMRFDLLRRSLTPHTRVILVTHLYGYPTDIDHIRNIVGDDRVLIIEDRAQKLADWDEPAPKLHGDLAICSLGVNKELCAVQGGVIVTNSADFYQRIIEYRSREMNQYSPSTVLKRWVRLLTNYGLYYPPIYGILHHLGIVGQNRRLDEHSAVAGDRMPADFATAWANFQGRIGLAQLSKLQAMMSQRRALAELYARELDGLPGIILPPLIPNANYLYYTLRVPNRDQIGFRPRMLARNVAVDETYEYALPYLKPYRHLINGISYPNAGQVAAQVINLPIYPALSIGDARYVAACVRDIVEQNPELFTW